MNTTRRSPGGMAQSFADHEDVLAALQQRDAALAEQVGRRHIARMRNELASEAGAR